MFVFEFESNSKSSFSETAYPRRAPTFTLFSKGQDELSNTQGPIRNKPEHASSIVKLISLLAAKGWLDARMKEGWQPYRTEWSIFGLFFENELQNDSENDFENDFVKHHDFFPARLRVELL
jgi:hypothetical protein